MSFAQQQGEGNSHEAAGLEELGWGQRAVCALSWTQLIILASAPDQPRFPPAGTPGCPPELRRCFWPQSCKLPRAAVPVRLERPGLRWVYFN